MIFLVAQPGGSPPRRYGAGQRVAGDVLDREHLGPGEARAPQTRGMGGQHLRRSRETPGAEQCDEAGENGLGGATVELLVGDGPGERFVG